MVSFPETMFTRDRRITTSISNTNSKAELDAKITADFQSAVSVCVCEICQCQCQQCECQCRCEQLVKCI